MIIPPLPQPPKSAAAQEMGAGCTTRFAPAEHHQLVSWSWARGDGRSCQRSSWPAPRLSAEAGKPQIRQHQSTRGLSS